MNKLLWALLALVLNHTALAALAPDVETGIRALQTQWAQANYQTPKDAQDALFEQLTAEAQALAAAHPDRPEPLVWEAIILSTHAGATGGLSALSKVKQARELLETAEKIDPTALDGSIYTSLGSLYYKVPGWPVGFGDDEKAEQYLKKALELNPQGIDANYFYGDFLREQGRYQDALTYLERALQAPPRPGRPLADEGRRAEIQAALAQVRAELGQSAQQTGR